MIHDDAETLPAQAGQFATTHWSLVLAAGGGDPRSRQACAQLYQAYWYPLYAFIRRHGHGPEDTHGLVQEFFTYLLEQWSLTKVDQGKGKFRSFLLGCLRHFLANKPDRLPAQKRGGGHAPVALDAALAERRYCLEPTDPASPEKLFERNWALALMEQALVRLRQEQRTWGKEAQFLELQSCLMTEPDAPRYAELAARLQTTEEAARLMVQRLRHRYRELLREEITRTADTPAEFEGEIRHLFSVLSS
jgi:RNA polymerase sigma-70 factor (ECF subfamily)